jgi:hypothetical protein
MNIKFHTKNTDLNVNDAGVEFNLHGPGGEFNVNFGWGEVGETMLKLEAMDAEMRKVRYSANPTEEVNRHRAEMMNVEAKLRGGMLLTGSLPPKMDKIISKN